MVAAQLKELREQIRQARELVKEIRAMDIRKQCADKADGILPVSFKLQDLAHTLSEIKNLASDDAEAGIDYADEDSE